MLPVRVLIRARADASLPSPLSVYLYARHIYFSGARAPRGRSPKVCRFKDREEHKLKVMARCVRVRSDVDVHRGPWLTGRLSLRRFWPVATVQTLSYHETRFSSSLFLPCSLERVPTRFSMCTPCQSDRYARQLVKQPSYQRMVRRIFQREGAAAGAKRGRGKRRSFPPRRGKGEGRRERDGPVAVGAIRCLEPRVVGNHLLGVKNSKLRVDMGLCLHRLQPTTGLRGTDVPVIPVALSLYIYISRFSPVARV